MFVCLLHLTRIPFAFLAKALDWLSLRIFWKIHIAAIGIERKKENKSKDNFFSPASLLKQVPTFGEKGQSWSLITVNLKPTSWLWWFSFLFPPSVLYPILIAGNCDALGVYGFLLQLPGQSRGMRSAMNVPHLQGNKLWSSGEEKGLRRAPWRVFLLLQVTEILQTAK